MTIVVIIPTYNEAENIGRLLDILVEEEFSKIKGHTMKILVVDDNSPDGTADVVRKKMQKYKNVELLTGEKKGLGEAFIRGMKYAMRKMEADAIIEMDADLQHNPRDVKRLVAAFDQGYDFVIGSRYIRGGSIPKEWEFYRKFISWAGNMFARLSLFLFKVHDVTSGFKLTRVEGFLDKVDLDNLLSKSYAYKIHLLYEVVKNRGAKVKEVPIKFHYRERGSSKIEQEDLRESLKVVIVLFIRSRFFKFAVTGFIGFLINAVSLELFAGRRVTEALASLFAFWQGEAGLGIVAEPSAWAAALAAEVAIMWNYTINNLWTFAEKRITEPLRFLWKFTHFNLTSAGAIIIQFIVIGSAVLVFGDTRLVRQAALIGSMPLVLSFNYTMYNIFIWKTWKLPFFNLSGSKS